MTDFTGNEVNIGDEVVFVTPMYKTLCNGVVSKITPSGVIIKYNKKYFDRPYGKDNIYRPFEQVYKI